jgi:predicted nucleic acid-binding protein
MIILDTNVISEMMKPSPSNNVIEWMASQPESALFTTTLTLAEVLYGLELLPAGKRRSSLSEATEIMFEQTFEGRVLDFDEDAARVFPTIMARRGRIGKPMGEMDAQIAAIARSRGAAVATRNTRDFIECGVNLIDPWSYTG